MKGKKLLSMKQRKKIIGMLTRHMDDLMRVRLYDMNGLIKEVIKIITTDDAEIKEEGDERL